MPDFLLHAEDAVPPLEQKTQLFTEIPICANCVSI